MPRAAAARGIGELRRTLRFQVLRVSFEIVTSDAAVQRAMQSLVQSAIQPGPPRRLVSFEVQSRNGGYEIFRDGQLEDVQFDPLEVVNTLYRATQREALTAWPDAILVRAVTGVHRQQRFLMIGETGTDRSAVGLRLAQLGADIQGDDLAILDGGTVTAYPRPLRRVGATDPPSPAVGSGWRITSGQCDVVVALEVNYGGQSMVREVPRRDMTRSLMSWSTPLGGNPLDSIRAQARLVDGARCCSLRLGDLSHLRSVWGC